MNKFHEVHMTAGFLT